MKLTPHQTSLLKPHIVSRLEKISEADNDVLADYVIELLKSDDAGRREIAANSKEQLSEFLNGQEVSFVDELLTFVQNESWDPQAVAKCKAERVPSTKAPTGSIRGGKSKTRGQAALHGGRGRKRGLEDDGDVVMQNSQVVSADDRPSKAARRGMRTQSSTRLFNPQQRAMQQLAGFSFDPSNPWAALLAMQQALAQQMGLQSTPRRQDRQVKKRVGKRCRDYDNKGFCHRGTNCYYEHELDYDEFHVKGAAKQGLDEDADASMTAAAPIASERGRSKAQMTRQDGRRQQGRSQNPLLGHSYDPLNTSIVIKNIPPEYLSQESVQSFFDQFGLIQDVVIHHEKALAVIKYAERGGAEAAHASPKVVFDNRFVKVHWHKSPIASAQYDNDHFDTEEFAKRQSAAQERYEHIRAIKEKHDELQQQIDAHQAEASRLISDLARKTGQRNDTDLTGDENESLQTDTEALKAKLAALENEARSMGIDPEAPFESNYHQTANPYFPRGRGRGGRGHAFSTLGRGQRLSHYHDSSLGDYSRGGGAGRAKSSIFQSGHHRRLSKGAVKRLDNRPRALAMTFAGDGESKAGGGEEMAPLDKETKQEALRQFLLYSDQMQDARIIIRDDATSDGQGDQDEQEQEQRHSAGINSTTLAVFSERYRAEVFVAALLAAGMELPLVGRVQVSWVANADLPIEASIDGGGGGGGGGGATSVATAATAATAASAAGSTVRALDATRDDIERGQIEVDYDVADDDDARWTTG